MLSGEGNAGERWKTTIGLISKKATLHVQHTFLYISLPLFCTTTTWNFPKLLSYTFWGGNVVRILVHLFFTATHFHLALVAASISHFVTPAMSLFVFVFFFFISRSRSLSPFSLVELRWPASYFFFFSVFRLLYIPNFVDMTINLSLIL